MKAYVLNIFITLLHITPNYYLYFTFIYNTVTPKRICIHLIAQFDEF